MLYNELRPTQISGLVGQEVVKDTLLKKLKTGTMTHSTLFVGVRGTGKTTSAKAVAKAVNCLSPLENGDACCQCENCRTIAEGRAMDVVEFDAATNSHVGDIRVMLEGKDNVPLMKKKVYIIDEVHMLSKEASNSLLKVIEEPPKNVMFILCTTELTKVLPTIRSRCATFTFRAIDQVTIASYLVQVCDDRHVTYELGAMYAIALAARGSMRDALSLLEPIMAGVEHITEQSVNDALGIMSTSDVTDMLLACFRKDSVKTKDFLENAADNGRAIDVILETTLCSLTDIISVRLSGNTDSVANTAEYKQQISEIASFVETEDVLELFEEMKKVRQGLYKDANPKLSMLCAFFSYIYREQRKDELKELKQEVEHLKKVVRNDTATVITSVTCAVNQEPVHGVPIEEEKENCPEDGFYAATEEYCDIPEEFLNPAFYEEMEETQNPTTNPCNTPAAKAEDEYDDEDENEVDDFINMLKSKQPESFSVEQPEENVPKESTAPEIPERLKEILNSKGLAVSCVQKMTWIGEKPEKAGVTQNQQTVRDTVTDVSGKSEPKPQAENSKNENEPVDEPASDIFGDFDNLFENNLFGNFSFN